MLGEGNVFKAADEEEAIEDVKVFAARFGDIGDDVLNEAADRLGNVREFYDILAAQSPEPHVEAPRTSVIVDTVVEEKVDEVRVLDRPLEKGEHAQAP